MNEQEKILKKKLLTLRLNKVQLLVSSVKNKDDMNVLLKEIENIKAEHESLKKQISEGNNIERKRGANKFLDRLVQSQNKHQSTSTDETRKERNKEKEEYIKKKKEERHDMYRKMRNEQLKKIQDDADKEQSKNSHVPDMSQFGILHIPLRSLTMPDFPYPCFETQTPPDFIKSLVGNLGDGIVIEGKDNLSSSSEYDTLGMFSTTCSSRTSAMECKPKIILKNSLNNNKDELCWTLAHELGHLISHNKKHFNRETHLGKMLEEGFCEVFAMFALPKHPKAVIIHNRAMALEGSGSYLDLLQNKWITESESFTQSYELLPAYIYRFVVEQNIDTIDELISHLYKHRRV